MDNLATHQAAALYEAYAPKEAKRIWDRCEFIYELREFKSGLKESKSWQKVASSKMARLGT
jgi:hypothetical protein